MSIKETQQLYQAFIFNQNMQSVKLHEQDANPSMQNGSFPMTVKPRLIDKYATNKRVPFSKDVIQLPDSI
jgi:hypothetical protein